jgi:transcriptional regulator with XRE-family HTH domain
MDGRRVGRVLRAVRLHKRLRQRDVAQAAGVSQSVVSRAERGLLTRVSLAQLDEIARILDITLSIDARWNRGIADRLVDAGHAAIVEAVVRELQRLGWTVTVEYGFNHYGDRGSVDVLAWHAATKTLLIVEVKTVLTDLQATFSSLARKVRIVPMLVRRELGWDAQVVGRLLVLPASHGNRTAVSHHAATFDSLLPARMPGIRSWLRQPAGPLAGVWFLTTSPAATRNYVQRVRRDQRTHAGSLRTVR